MARFNIKKGLHLPISGEPQPTLDTSLKVSTVSLLGSDYHGIKPSFAVNEGDPVKLGQTLFTDKLMPEVRFTAPAAGRVVAIHRGEKRIFLSIVIQIEDERTERIEKFSSYNEYELNGLSADKVRALLLQSGLWTALRTRPYSKIANPHSEPHSIFVTTMDTNPLALPIDKILEGNMIFFQNGLTAISKLTKGKIHLCKDKSTTLSVQKFANLEIHDFSGIHPAGNTGVHIHLIDPVSKHKTVWSINCQDVIDVGKLFMTGRLPSERIISLAGPGVINPRLVKTRVGASILQLTKNQLKPGTWRVIGGSVYTGRAVKDEIVGYLGRFQQQISVIEEDTQRRFLGWLSLGHNQFSKINLFLSRLFRNKKFDFTTSTNGSRRAMVPIGTYERVTPMNLIPTVLLRSLIVNDIERAEQLGCLELDEEDVALFSFVCPGKYDYGPILRKNLELIEKEG